QGEAAAAGGRALRLRAERGAHWQGAFDATQEAQMALGTAQGSAAAVADVRATVDEDRGSAKASRSCRIARAIGTARTATAESAIKTRKLSFHARQGEASHRAPARGALSPALELDRHGSCRALAVLSAADRGGSRVQGSEKRAVDPADLPPTRGSHRSTHLRRFPRLLRLRHVKTAAEGTRTRTHRAASLG